MEERLLPVAAQRKLAELGTQTMEPDVDTVMQADPAERGKVQQLCEETLKTYIITRDCGSSVIHVHKTAAQQTREGENLMLVSCYTASKE